MTTVIGCTETKAYAMKVNTVMKMQITHLSRVWVGQVRVLFLCVISGRQKQKRKEKKTKESERLLFPSPHP